MKGSLYVFLLDSFFYYLFIYLSIYLSIYLWLCRVLVVAHGIFHCGMQALHCSAWASLWLWRVGSVVAAHGLSCPEACGILVRCPGIEPTSPALEGGFFNHWTTREVPILNFLKNLHTVFHSGYTNLHSHQLCTGVPFFPHPRQYFLFLVFLLITILTDVR